MLIIDLLQKSGQNNNHMVSFPYKYFPKNIKMKNYLFTYFSELIKIWKLYNIFMFHAYGTFTNKYGFDITGMKIYFIMLLHDF